MRCFLGLDIAPSTKLAIDTWRSKALPAFEKPVPAANFHNTLVFLGQIDAAQHEQLVKEIDALVKTPIEIHYDVLGFWSKPQILFIAPTKVDDKLNTLATTLSGIAKKCRLDVRQGEYKPHITLVRKVKSNPPCALMAPDFTCRFDKMHLFESVSGAKGVQYPIRHTWSLQHNA